MTCSICQKELATRAGDNNPTYVTCSGCGTVQLVPLPLFESNEAFQGEDVARHMAATDRARGEYLRRRLRLLGTDGRGRRLLDVGCSTGELMRLAREGGWLADGVEMSEELAGLAREQNPGARVLTQDILALAADELPRYDAIVALDVIEHVVAPRDFVRRLATMLAPGGRLLLQTPNAGSLRARLHAERWNMRLPEYHFHLFTAAGLRGLLESEGLRVIVSTKASGSGTETGAGKVLALIKEKLLAAAGLGNALVMVCEKPG